MSSGGTVGPALLKFGVGVMERSTGSLIARAVRWLRGNSVLLVGQARGGKTSFRDYLRYGFLDDEKPTEKTHDVTTTGAFKIDLGRDKELQLIFRSLKELPGQYGPVAHANLAFEHRPHALIVMSDLTAPLTGEPEKVASTWLEEFCKHLETRWRAAGGKRNRLRSQQEPDAAKALLLQQHAAYLAKVDRVTFTNRALCLFGLIGGGLLQALLNVQTGCLVYLGVAAVGYLWGAELRLVRLRINALEERVAKRGGGPWEDEYIKLKPPGAGDVLDRGLLRIEPGLWLGTALALFLNSLPAALAALKGG
jgi:hypothetical protein